MKKTTPIYLLTLLLFCVIIFFTPFNLIAQYKISGYVITADTAKKLTAASVYIADLKLMKYTDEMGYYQFDNLKPGKYILETNLENYKPIIEQLDLVNDTILNFELTPMISEFSEIIVTGVPRLTELKRSPISIKIIDKNTLNQQAATNLIDALKNIPGISQITTGTAISKPVIRGLGYNRIITLNNGIKQEGQQWGDEHGIELDEYAVARVEIVKGAGSLMYGSDALAGVLNFLPPKSLPSGKVKTQLLSNYQTNHHFVGYSISNAGNKKGFQWLARFSNKLAGNYKNAYDGKVYNSGFKEFDGNLFLGINKNWGHSYFTISSYNNTLNLPEGERDSLGRFTYTNSAGNVVVAQDKDYSAYKIGFPHQKINHLSFVTNHYFLLKKGTLNVDLGFQNNKRKEFGDPTNPKDKTLFFDLNTLNYRLKYDLKKTKNWETSIGLGGMWQSNENKGLEFLIPEYHLGDIGLFLFTQKTFDKLTIAGGLRVDNRYINSKTLYLADSELKFKPFTKNYKGISGSFGLSYIFNKSSLIKFNLSRGFRAPNIAELASNGEHEGTFKYEIGNPNLKPENNHQIDLGYFLNTDHISFEFTPFVNFINHYIYTQREENQSNTIDSLQLFRFKSGDVTLLGGEIYLDIHPHPFDNLHLENTFSYVQATQHNQPQESKYLPLIPAPHYKGEISYQFKKLFTNWTNTYIKFGVNHFFTQNKIFSAYDTETKTPAYTLLNIGFGTTIKTAKQKEFINLYISGENLTNKAYQNHLSHLKYAPKNINTGRIGIYDMGRNISLKVILNF